MTKANLKLVWSNPKQAKQKSKLQMIWEWLTKARVVSVDIPPQLRWWKTEQEKGKILESALTQAFGDFDYTTDEVNIYPALRAKDKVKEMIENDTLDYYFKRWEMSQKHLKKMDKMAAKFERKIT